MANFNISTQTNLGAQADAAKAQITITRVQVGEGLITNQNPQALNNLIKPVMDVDLIGTNNQIPTQFTILFRVDAKKVKTEFKLSEYGIFAKTAGINKGEEFLYIYANAGESGDIKAELSSYPQINLHASDHIPSTTTQTQSTQSHLPTP